MFDRVNHNKKLFNKMFLVKKWFVKLIIASINCIKYRY